MGTPRLMLILFLAIGVVVVAAVGLAAGSWWIFGLALAVHLAATVFVVAFVMHNMNTGHQMTAAERKEVARDTQRMTGSHA